jgi:hypothetical protein
MNLVYMPTANGNPSTKQQADPAEPPTQDKDDPDGE